MLASTPLCTMTFAVFIIIVSATWSDTSNGVSTLVQLYSRVGVEDQILYAGDDFRHVPHLSSDIGEGSIATRSSGPLRLNESSGDQGDSDDGSDVDVAGTGNEAACNGSHPNADDPEMLHVAYASDLRQVEGLQASVASMVTSAATPKAVTVHIMVQAESMEEVKVAFGLRQNCRGAITVNGTLILFHEIQAEQIKHSVSKVSKETKESSGHLESLAQFSRLYMHLILGPAVADSIVVYLDADTIVQADLGQMRQQLRSSNKTIGFAARRNMMYMEDFLKTPTNCDLKDLAPTWSSMMKKPCYNTGVLVVDLHRWVQSGAIQRIEHLVSLHNKCGGTLWDGGSQPPMVLAFLNHPESSPEDFLVLDAAWNTVEFDAFNLTMLKSMKVLHYKGKTKPWSDKYDGKFQDVWKKHRERFDSLLQH